LRKKTYDGILVRLGYFDLVLASHQIWHLASLAAFVYWYQNGVELLQYRLMNSCNTQVE
jgi:hypothetical protein